MRHGKGKNTRGWMNGKRLVSKEKGVKLSEYPPTTTTKKQKQKQNKKTCVEYRIIKIGNWRLK